MQVSHTYADRSGEEPLASSRFGVAPEISCSSADIRCEIVRPASQVCGLLRMIYDSEAWRWRNRA